MPFENRPFSHQSQPMPSDQSFQQNFSTPGMSGDMMTPQALDPDNMIEYLKNMLQDTANRL